MSQFSVHLSVRTRRRADQLFLSLRSRPPAAQPSIPFRQSSSVSSSAVQPSARQVVVVSSAPSAVSSLVRPKQQSETMSSSKGSHAVEENLNVEERIPIDLTNDEDVETPSSKLFLEGKLKVVCKLCGHQLSGETKNGTSHLCRHTKEHCPRRHENTRDVSQMLLGANKNGKDKEVVGNYVFNQEASRRELTFMIIEHEYPLSIVDHCRFRSYTNSLNLMFKIPTRNTIKVDCMKIYSEYRLKMIDEMRDGLSRISVTTNLGTLKHQKKGYMTAHYIDNSWILRKRLLRLCYVLAPHNATIITKYLIGCVDNWSLEHRLGTITVDNASNNDLAVQFLILKIKSGALLLNESFFHVRCAAHILNLIVQDGLEVIKDAIGKVRDRVLF